MANQWIERYVYAVTKRLPLKMKDDVAKELRANIDDMLGRENPTDEEIKDVLQKLGHPRKLAREYLGDDHYVVAPEYYYDYISTLKLVGVIFLIVSLVTGFISAISALTSETIWQALGVLTETLADQLWSGIVFAFAAVTIGFWIAGEVQKKQQPKAWELKDLPELPKPTTLKIKRGETVVGLILGVSLGLTFVVLVQVGLPFFDPSVVSVFVPFLYFSIALDIVIGSLQLAYGEWRWPVVGVYTFSKVYSVGLAYFFLYSDFIDAVWLQAQLDQAGIVYEEVQAGMTTGFHVIFAIIALATLADLIQLYVRVLKAQRSVK